MNQDHDHSHEGHGHGVSGNSDRRWIAVALGVTAAFMGVEVAVALIANSLALLSDAAHNLTDAASIGLALAAIVFAARPPSGRYTFGLGRAEILSAQVNGISLLVLGAIIGFEAIRRIINPPDVEGLPVIVIGVLGAAVNLVAAWALSRAKRQSLNVEGARAHIMADLFSSIAAAIAGAIVVLTGFLEADGVAAAIIAAYMLRSGVSLVSASGRILLEGTPTGVDSAAIGEAMAAQPGVREVHDLHIWEVTSGFPALAAHVIVEADHDCHQRRLALQQMLSKRFEIEHVTLQVDHEPRPGPIQIAPLEPT